MEYQIAKPGPRNDITDVGGIAVGQASDPTVKTGVTAIVPNVAAICGGDVRGGGPGARETDLLDPSTLVDRADAIILSGGSSYGLAAADGAATALGAQGRGFQLVPAPGVPPSPIVPSAILYDLANGGDKTWGVETPYARLGVAAVKDASLGGSVALGRAGAGYGAMAGDGVGGLGSASAVMSPEITVGAIVAVNSFGSPRMSGSEAFWAWPFEQDREFGGARPPTDWRPSMDMPPDTKLAAAGKPRANTTIGVVAVSAALSQADAQRVAIMAQDGLARALRPAHGPTDGDVVFALATDGPPAGDPLTLTRIGNLAADCLARAIARGVYEAEKQTT